MFSIMAKLSVNYEAEFITFRLFVREVCTRVMWPIKPEIIPVPVGKASSL